MEPAEEETEATEVQIKINWNELRARNGQDIRTSWPSLYLTILFNYFNLKI